MTPEQTAMQLIIGAGQAKKLAFDAIQAARDNHIETTDQLLEQATKALAGAHQIQSDALRADAATQQQPTLLMVHAQDHLSMAMTAMELGREIVAIYRRLSENTNDK